MPSTVDSLHGPSSGTSFAGSPSAARPTFRSIISVRLNLGRCGTANSFSSVDPDRARAMDRSDALASKAA
jgi:hypothetical protein